MRLRRRTGLAAAGVALATTTLVGCAAHAGPSDNAPEHGIATDTSTIANTGPDLQAGPSSSSVP